MTCTLPTLRKAPTVRELLPPCKRRKVVDRSMVVEKDMDDVRSVDEVAVGECIETHIITTFVLISK